MRVELLLCKNNCRVEDLSKHNIMKRPTLSLRATITAGVSLGLLALVASTGIVLWGLDAARESVARARHSYEQLALVSRMEANFGRLLVFEIQHMVEPGTRDRTSQKAMNDIDSALNRLILDIRTEAKSLRDEHERELELKEIQNAYALRALYKNMLNGINRERETMRAHVSGEPTRKFINNVVGVDYAHLNRIVQSVITDERSEVRAAISRLDKLNATLVIAVAVVLAASTLLAAGGALTVYRKVTAPLDALTRGAEALAKGDNSHRIEANGPIEFVALSNTFNNMARKIQAHHEELIRTNETLEDAVKKRTNELREKAEQLAEVDKNRRLFFAKVSHELRTPLTVLLADAELALKNMSADTTALQSALAHIFAQGEFLKRRISDLINLARSEDGKLVLDKTTFALDILLNEIASDAEAYARSNDVELKILLPPKTVYFTGDKSWLRQGLLSIIDNAIKFSPLNGDVHIALTCRNTLIEISVEDEGPGAPAEELPRLFDPYYQVSNESKRGGTGLGLAVGRWVAEQHNGLIFAQNADAGGLRIRVELPVES